MANVKLNNSAYTKHQHKIMILLGLVIVLFTYGSSSHLGPIFGH